MRLVVLCFVIFPLVAYGQTRISGTIKDDRGGVVPGANISIQGSYDGTSSDSKGEFYFSTTETGAQVLPVTFVGYQNLDANTRLCPEYG